MNEFQGSVYKYTLGNYTRTCYQEEDPRSGAKLANFILKSTVGK